MGAICIKSANSWGNEINPVSSDSNPFRYCGEYYDKEIDTIYLRARYYDPEMGRFITADSYTVNEKDPLSLNLYTYCHNDPVNRWDPSGHQATPEPVPTPRPAPPPAPTPTPVRKLDNSKFNCYAYALGYADRWLQIGRGTVNSTSMYSYEEMVKYNTVGKTRNAVMNDVGSSKIRTITGKTAK